MWNYKIDLKETWKKYADYSHSDYDEDENLFSKMKGEMISEIKKQVWVMDAPRLSPILQRLNNAKHLSTFNEVWNDIYDYCDEQRIWLSTNF